MSQKEAEQSIQPIIDVLIPAYNEEESISLVVKDVPGIVRHVLVVNNNSTDRTGAKAKAAGAIVIDEPQMGYGKACLTGMAFLSTFPTPPDILVFLDGDYSDYPEQLVDLISPIVNEGYDMVIGSRAKGKRQTGSMTPPQVFGNWLATSLMRWIYKVDYTDLGPFRAIKWKQLGALGMVDQNYGWTVEMQIKAAKHGLKSTEIPVDYRKRIGVSKVSGTIKGVIGAGYKILWTIWKYR